MPDRLSIHAPLVVNTIGHCAGAIAFGILLYLLLVDWKRDSRERSALPSIAAGLALLWNVGSLIGIATAPSGDAIADAIVAASFSVLSIMPAVLLHISLRSGRPALWMAGYAVSACAVALHVGDVVTGASRFHYAALLLVTIGFGILTVLLVILEAVSHEKGGAGARLAGAMVLFLFAISFVHFGSSHDAKAWSGEAALHHAGIPLALFVLLQDYRFLLLDAFIRFLVNGVLAATSVWAVFQAEDKFHIFSNASHEPFAAGLMFTGACLLLSLFAWVRARAQRFLTSVVFLRSNADATLARLRFIAAESPRETQYLQAAAAAIGEFFSAPRVEVAAGTPDIPTGGRAVVNPGAWDLPLWVRAVAPVRFSRGDSCALMLGDRLGGRRYLSEDIDVLNRLALVVVEQVERMRSTEMQSLVLQAELRALQAQINPHFLFNALNTLYGIIGRENAPARRLVVNLSQLFRYSFAAGRGMIRLDEELRIVRGYLEIEQLRLGAKLATEIEVDDEALQAEVPVLSIQPLVENAVRHGVASQAGPGFVHLRIRGREGRVEVEVSNSGEFRAGETGGHGVGLSNVRRRLQLCYGTGSSIEVASEGGVTAVRFSLPNKSVAAVPA
jgi:two-component system LytT family sensor kinase